MQEKELSSLIRSVVEEITKKESPRTEMELFRTDHIPLEMARTLIRKVEDKATEMGMGVVVAVANAAGRPIAVECLDDSYIASYDVALNKAFTVAALKMSTSELKPLAQPGGSLYGIQFTNDSKIVIFGAVYLGVVALLPLITGKLIPGAGSLAIGGTSVIIVIGVALETVKAIEAQMLMRHYKGFLD